MVKVAVDAMGGDNAPAEIIKGAVDAAIENPKIKIILVGKQENLSMELKKYNYPKERFEIVNADEIIMNILTLF